MVWRRGLAAFALQFARQWHNSLLWVAVSLTSQQTKRERKLRHSHHLASAKKISQSFLASLRDTLRKHYDAELEVSPIKANGEVGQYLHALASGRAARDGVATPADCTRAAIFWAKTRMGWRETNNLDLSSSDGTMSPREIIIRAADGKG
jgi:hypothetical protein